MSETVHIIVVGAIMAMFPASMLAFLIHIVVRDWKLDQAEKKELKEMRRRIKK